MIDDWEPHKPKTVYLIIPLEKFRIKISMAEMYMLLNESDRTRKIWKLGRDRLLNSTESLNELELIRLKNEVTQEENHKRKKRHIIPWELAEIDFLKRHADELTYQEMAKVLNRSIESVKAKVRRVQGKRK